MGSFTLVLPYFPTGTGGPDSAAGSAARGSARAADSGASPPPAAAASSGLFRRLSWPSRPPELRPAPACLPAAERVEAEGDVATAFTLARIISNIPLARGGPGAPRCRGRAHRKPACRHTCPAARLL